MDEKHPRNLKKLAALGLPLLICTSSEAHAYFDPGTGALIIQAAVGLGLYVLVNTKKLVGKFTGLFKKSEEKSEE